MAKSLCVHCGGEFIDKGRRLPQVYCSSRCRNQAWALAHPRGRRAASVPEGRGQVGSLPIVAPEGANRVSDLDELRARIAVLEQRPLGRAGNVEPAKGWKHGANCYRNHGCRCAMCVEGMRRMKR